MSIRSCTAQLLDRESVMANTRIQARACKSNVVKSSTPRNKCVLTSKSSGSPGREELDLLIPKAGTNVLQNDKGDFSFFFGGGGGFFDDFDLHPGLRQMVSG